MLSSICFPLEICHVGISLGVRIIMVSGGGSFLIQKFILQVLDLYIGFFGRSPKKIATIFSEKEGGGQIFPKIIRFGTMTYP